LQPQLPFSAEEDTPIQGTGENDSIRDDDVGNSNSNSEALLASPDTVTSSPKVRERGFVTTIKDSYGFVSCVDREGELFFHVSELDTGGSQAFNLSHRDIEIRDFLSRGTEVEFSVQPSRRGDRLNARELTVLPKGTIKTHKIGEQVLRGEVSQACTSPHSVRGADKDQLHGIIKVVEVLSGPNEDCPGSPVAAVGDTIPFRREDCEDFEPLQVGACVRFSVSSHRRTNRRRAVGVEALGEPTGVPRQREVGIVVALKESFGFIRPAQRNTPEAFFHFSELVGGIRPSVGAIVAYKMEYSKITKKDVAVRVEILPDDQLPPGPSIKAEGLVKIPCDGGTGMLLFRDPQMCEQTCSFVEDIVSRPEGEEGETAEPLRLYDEVEVEAQLDLLTECYRATSVRLIRRAVDKVEYGRVEATKNSFGFIKCCARASDMFFRFASLTGGLSAESIAVGTDVQFRVIREPATGKLNAVDVGPAPEGKVVFETVGDTVHSGVVLERNFARGSAAASGMSGLIEFIDEGLQRHITFFASEVSGMSPKPGDPVTFRIATDLRAAQEAMQSGSLRAAVHGATRATQVAVVRESGVVVAVRASFGFIEYRVPPPSSSDQPRDGEAKPMEELCEQGTAPAVQDSSTTAGAAGAAGKACSRADDGEGERGAQLEERPAGGPSWLSSSNGGAGGDRGEEPSGSRRERVRRIFFHVSEVQGGAPLVVGDRVEFTVATNPKTGELNGRHVVRTKEAPPRPERPTRRPAEETARRAPAALVAQVHQPLMPDGTRGFAFGRGKGLEGVIHPPLGLRPPPPPPSQPSKPKPSKTRGRGQSKRTVLTVPVSAGRPAGRESSHTMLNAEAQPFIPRSWSSSSGAEAREV